MHLWVLSCLCALVASGELNANKESIDDAETKTPVTSESKCYSCTAYDSCEVTYCSDEKEICLNTVEVIGLSKNQFAFRMKGICVAPERCQPHFYSIYYGAQLRSWINVTCCSGDNCKETPRHSRTVTLPGASPSDVLCPICPLGEAPCDRSLYLRCFEGETSCVNISLRELREGVDLTIQGCGTENLCQLQKNSILGLDFQVLEQPKCISTHQTKLDSRWQHNAAIFWGCDALLPALLGAWLATWLA